MGRPTDWWVLDLEEDPTPGIPARVRQCADQIIDLATDAGRAEREVRSLAGDNTVLSWIGLSGDAFRDQIGELPDELRKLHTSYRMAGEALDRYAPKLESAQAQADEALVKGREARSRRDAAQGQLGGAEDWVRQAGRTATDLQSGANNPQPPAEADVRAAVRNQQAAQARLDQMQGQLNDAQGDLDAARRLALQAKEVRLEAARTCAKAIDDASDAGIQNKPWWSWDKISGFLAEAWDFLVAACKIVVMVLGVVVLIIGGPLAWVVFAAALVVLADTLLKYIKGKASLWDVAFAALDCIPGTKGLTTLGRLKSLHQAGGMLNIAKTGFATSRAALRTTAQRMRGTAIDLFGSGLARKPNFISDNVANHVLDGHFNAKGKPVGFHHAPNGVPPAGRRIDAVTHMNANGTYGAKVSMENAAGNWKPKTVPQHTMFPDNWSPARVRDAGENAFANSTPGTGANSWQGDYAGVNIQGYLGPDGKPSTFFPGASQPDPVTVPNAVFQGFSPGPSTGDDDR